jgi:hypothetical protein
MAATLDHCLLIVSSLHWLPLTSARLQTSNHSILDWFFFKVKVRVKIILYDWRFTAHQLILASRLLRFTGFGSPDTVSARTQQRTPLPTVLLLLRGYTICQWDVFTEPLSSNGHLFWLFYVGFQPSYHNKFNSDFNLVGEIYARRLAGSRNAQPFWYLCDIWGIKCWLRGWNLMNLFKSKFLKGLEVYCLKTWWKWSCNFRLDKWNQLQQMKTVAKSF